MLIAFAFKDRQLAPFIGIMKHPAKPVRPGKMTADALSTVARANVRDVLDLLAPIETKAVPSMREGETTAAGKCFRRVTGILSGKESIKP